MVNGFFFFNETYYVIQGVTGIIGKFNYINQTRIINNNCK